MIDRGRLALLALLVSVFPAAQMLAQTPRSNPAGWQFSVRSPQAQQGSKREENLFRVETVMVLVDVLVLDERTGIPLTGLDSRDLVLYEDRVEQHLSHFSRDRLPLAVLLMVDVSTSVQQFFPSILQAARDSLTRFREGDRIAIMAFAGTTQVVQGFSRDRALLAAKIGDVSKATEVGEDLTWIDNSVYQAARYIRWQSRTPERRVLLVISDNEEAPLPSQGFSRSQAMTQLDEGGIVLCSILRGGARLEMIYGTGKKNRLLRSMRKHYKPGSLKHFSDRSGGLVISPDSDLNRALPQLIELLRARYTIGYYPSNPVRDGRFRRIQVRLSDSGKQRLGSPSLKVRYGYILNH